MKKSLAVEVVRHEFPELKACEDDWAVRIWLANACKVYARTARERRELVENVHLARVRRLKAKRRELLRTLHAVRNMREFAGGREDDGVDEEQAWEDDFGEDDFAEDELEEDQDYGYGPREDQGWGINQESPLDRRYGQEEQRERIQFRRPPNAGDLMGVRRNLLGRLEVVRGEVEERRMRRLNEVRRVLLNLGAEGVGDEMREHFEEMARRINPNGEGELLEDGMATREVHERQLELLAQRMVAAEEMRRGVI